MQHPSAGRALSETTAVGPKRQLSDRADIAVLQEVLAEEKHERARDTNVQRESASTRALSEQIRVGTSNGYVQ
ncbi:hypothetical protein CGZ69_01500 [Streptomyces peucetius subsp. caesius ATCC 27952]|nr:hypothetical protein CGZ69_01500 [Streptomyces peucetius subsp. caesius ATCC 27952]